jgi:hypothetical protein
VLSHHFGFARIFAVPFRADHLALAWRWLDLIFEGFERLRHARCSPAFTLIYIDTPAAFSSPKRLAVLAFPAWFNGPVMTLSLYH